MSLKSVSQALLIASLTLTLPACSFVDWLVYKQDKPQGNFLEKKDIEKLRIEMSKEQVAFIIGRPVVEDIYGGDKWRYVYHFKSGHNAEVRHLELILNFKDNKLIELSGDYEASADFNTPIEQ